MAAETNPLNIFILFDDDDAAVIESIEKHCAAMVKQGEIRVWHHRKINPGQLIETEMKRNLEIAEVILLMISSSLLNSERFYEVEKISLERLYEGKSMVIPVYLKYCLFTGYAFTQLQMLPADGEPVVNEAPDLDARFRDIAIEIHHLVDTRREDDRAAGNPLIPAPDKHKQGAMPILFIINNPSEADPELLNKEINSIKTRILLGKCSCRYELVPKNVKTIEELQRAFLETRPKMVHFSGYSTHDRSLVFLDSDQKKIFVSPSALKGLFSEFNDQLELVFLNACYSDQQAPNIAEAVNFVIGIDGPVGDVAILDFIRGFYQAISYGTSIRKAFNLGKNLLELKNEDSFNRIVMLEKDVP